MSVNGSFFLAFAPHEMVTIATSTCNGQMDKCNLHNILTHPPPGTSVPTIVIFSVSIALGHNIINIQ